MLMAMARLPESLTWFLSPRGSTGLVSGLNLTVSIGAALTALGLDSLLLGIPKSLLISLLLLFVLSLKLLAPRIDLRVLCV